MFWNRKDDPGLTKRVADLEAEVASLKRIVDEMDETYARRLKKLTARNGSSPPAVEATAGVGMNGAHSRWWLRRHGHGVPEDVPATGG